MPLYLELCILFCIHVLPAFVAACFVAVDIILHVIAHGWWTVVCANRGVHHTHIRLANFMISALLPSFRFLDNAENVLGILLFLLLVKKKGTKERQKWASVTFFIIRI